MLKITLATSNEHKVKEINLIAKDAGIEFVLPDAKKGKFEPDEVGLTFLDNAKIKAFEAAKISKYDLILADDSGLCVDALSGAPGIHSARYAPTADERIEKLLSNMKDKAERSAKFVCAMVLANREGEILFETVGECEGEIMYEPKGSGGFGYDPVFYVKDKNRGMAELSDFEKSEVSHRGRALRDVFQYLKKYYLN